MQYLFVTGVVRPRRIRVVIMLFKLFIICHRAFCRLKTTLPWVPADTKLSKLDTLRLASSYIAHLKGILRDDPFAPEEPLHPAINLVIYILAT